MFCVRLSGEKVGFDVGLFEVGCTYRSAGLFVGTGVGFLGLLKLFG